MLTQCYSIAMPEKDFANPIDKMRELVKQFPAPKSADPNKSICAHCRKSQAKFTTELQTCSECHVILYCSKRCQLANLEHHKKECPFLKLMNTAMMCLIEPDRNVPHVPTKPAGTTGDEVLVAKMQSELLQVMCKRASAAAKSKNELESWFKMAAPRLPEEIRLEYEDTFGPTNIRLEPYITQHNQCSNKIDPKSPILSFSYEKLALLYKLHVALQKEMEELLDANMAMLMGWTDRETRQHWNDILTSTKNGEPNEQVEEHDR